MCLPAPFTLLPALGSTSSPGELHDTDTLEINTLKIENCEVEDDNVDLSEPKDALDEAGKLLEQLNLQ